MFWANDTGISKTTFSFSVLLCVYYFAREAPQMKFFEFILFFIEFLRKFYPYFIFNIAIIANKMSEKNHFQLTSFHTVFSVLNRVADWFLALLMSSDYVWKIIFSVFLFGKYSNIIHEIRVKFSQEFNKNKINSKKCHLRGLSSKIVHRKKYTERKSDFSYASIICPEQSGTQKKAPSVL